MPDQTHSLINLIGEERGEHENYDAYRSPLLHTPRYLDYVIKIVNNEGVEAIVDPNLGRPSHGYLFEKILDLRLKEEFEKPELTPWLDELKRHVMGAKLLQQKLALVMYLYGRRHLTEEETIIFFDELNSNLVRQFQGRKALRYFYERSLLKPMDTWVEFDNKDIHDFLVARELQRLGETNLAGVVSQFCLDKQTRLIPIWWWDALYFLCERLNDCDLLLLLIDHCTSWAFSDTYADQQLPGNFAQCTHLNEQVLKKLSFEPFASEEKERMAAYLWNFQKRYYAETYGWQPISLLLTDLLPAIDRHFLDRAFQTGEYKLVLGVFLCAEEQTWSTQLGEEEWKCWQEKFWHLTQQPNPILETRFWELFLEVFFTAPNPSLDQLAEPKAWMEQDLPQQLATKDRYLAFWESQEEVILALPEEIQRVFQYHRGQVFRFIQPMPKEGIKEFVRQALMQGTKKERLHGLARTIEKLETPEAWLAFFDLLHQQEKMRGILEGHSAVYHLSLSNTCTSRLTKALSDESEETRLSLRLAYQSYLRVLGTSSNIRQLSPWVSVIVEAGLFAMPEEWPLLSQPASHLSLWQEVQFWETITQSVRKESISKQIFEHLFTKDRVRAWHYFTYCQSIDVLSVPTSNEIRAIFSEEFRQERSESASQQEIEREQREYENQAETQRIISAMLSEWDKLLDTYEITPEQEKFPEQLFDLFLKLFHGSPNLDSRETAPYLKRLEPIVYSYLRDFPDLREVTLRLEEKPNRQFCTAPPSHIWNFPAVIQLLTSFSTLSWKHAEEKLWFAIWLLPPGQFDWWWHQVGKTQGEAEWESLYQHFITRKDDAILFQPATLLQLIKKYPIPQAYPLLQQVLLGALQHAVHEGQVGSPGLALLKHSVFLPMLTLDDLWKLKEASAGFPILHDELSSLEATRFQSVSIVEAYLDTLLEDREFLFDPARNQPPNPLHERSIEVSVTSGDRPPCVSTRTALADPTVLRACV
ncbi:MAG: hypothetical protein AAF399_25170 [Bacteroidota bacterium]